jgi:acetylornithine deacetylase/succinyl-diaminopimelate desuccinylase-like protein
MAIKAQGGAHARCVILIEASEESDGTDLTLYIEEQKERIGDVNLVVCLDSGAGNESQLWLTTTLRGVVNGSIKVR